MLFIETPNFTEDVQALLNDDEFAALQRHLSQNPMAGDIIVGAGGLRKVRWSAMGKVKSGGVRVIYYHVVSRSHIRMILIYRKGIKDDLSPKEKGVLRKINAEWR